MNAFPQEFLLQVTHGKGRGLKIGIPTINFIIPKDINIVEGIYAGILIEDNQWHNAAIHFGPRPQFDEFDPSFEVMLLEKKLNELKNEYKIILVAWIREIKKFNSVEEMLRQIEADVKQINKELTHFRQ